MSTEGELIDPFCNENDAVSISFESIASAAVMIKSGIVKTPCNKSRMSEMAGMNIYLKNEFMQYTGSFKERGARYAMLMLSPETRKSGVVSASAGNHAQAMSWHGLDLKIPVTVVMPEIAPIMKIQKCRNFKANVIVEGKNMQEAKNIAMKMAKDKGSMYINGYDHPHILAGQGTIGIEILEQVPDVDAIVIPCGGGGLIAGIAKAVKTLKPEVQIIGVESVNSIGFTNSMRAGKPVLSEVKPTLADGLAVPLVGYNSIATSLDTVDKMINVKEEDIAVSILRLVEMEKYVVEGAGATALAGVLSGQLDELKGKNVVLILSGGNIDTTVLGRVLERGLAADGRFVKVYVMVSDRPGGLAELLGIIASIGVAVKHLGHERNWTAFDIFSVNVKAVCETRDFDHALELEQLLKSRYKTVEFYHAEFPESSAYAKARKAGVKSCTCSEK